MDALRANGATESACPKRSDPDGPPPLLCLLFAHSNPRGSLVTDPGALLLARPRNEAPVYVCELTRRRYRGKQLPEIRSPDDVIRLVGRKLRKESREHFLVLLLNARHEVTGRETVSVGSLNASIVHPREVFRPAVLASAAATVLVHNHPSGDPEPSEEDLAITKRLVQAGDLLGISVLDHVIVASRGVVSLRARQQL